MLRYRLTVFLASFLLFQIEFIFSKAILPVLGGAYMVWATCMLFFQGTLLLGYLYSHLSQKLIGVFRYSKWHILLLLIPFLAFPFQFEKLASFKLSANPILAVFYLFIINCALAFFTLSTISLILQNWLYISNLPERKNPYVLYSASNLGAILGILTYPLFFEPLFTLNQQGYIWWAGYLTLLILSAFCLPRKFTEEQPLKNTTEKQIKPEHLLQWFLLSLAGCFTLLAITNSLTVDIAAIPFLWCLPLAVYLLSFVLVFKHDPWYPDWLNKAFAAAIAIGVTKYLMGLFRMGFPAGLNLIIELSLLFIICLNCHGKLAQLKPAEKNKLTIFYFSLALGGFAGSFLVGIIFPLVTKSLLEYPVSFFIASLALAYPFQKQLQLRQYLPQAIRIVLLLGLTAFVLAWLPIILTESFRLSPRAIMICITFLIFVILRIVSSQPAQMTLVLLFILIFHQQTEKISLSLSKTFKSRNFYGINFVYEKDNQRYLQHGTTLHGRQYISGPKTSLPLGYFHPSTPAGKLLTAKSEDFKKSAMVGLGTGALSSYFKKDSFLTIYELDPDTLMIAKRFFGYLKQAEDKGVIINYIFGDGRISLGRAPSAEYDLLIIDVFNSDAIPPHLITVEAIREYKRVLNPNGIILIHISNRIFDLKPVIYSAGEKCGFYVFENTGSETVTGQDADICTWMVLCRNLGPMQKLLEIDGWISDGKVKRINPWTDQYVNFLGSIKNPFVSPQE